MSCASKIGTAGPTATPDTHRRVALFLNTGAVLADSDAEMLRPVGYAATAAAAMALPQIGERQQSAPARRPLA